MTDKLKLPTLPEFKVNASKSGYEIRTQILDMAKNFVTRDFEAKFQGWELSSQRDTSTNQILTTVEMPKFPGLEVMLDTAEKMYEFVNKTTKSK
jgi:hypothetical protein